MSEKFEMHVTDVLMELKEFCKEQKKFNAEQLKFNEEQKKFNRMAMKKFEKIENVLKEHSKKLEKLEMFEQDATYILLQHNKKFEEYDENFKFIKRILIKIEDDMNTKIPILFDSYSANQDKHKQYDEKINNLDIVTEDHSVRISNLKFITSKK